MLLDKRNLNIYVIADYISALPIGLVFYFVYNLVKKPLFDKYYLLGFVGTFVSSLTADFIKRLPYPDKYNSITKRPKGANYWDILSKNDYRNKKNPPGFPSGHMTMVTFFSTYLIFGSETILEKTFLIGLVIATVWARYIKRVHNIPQILAGTLLGAVYGILFYRLN